MRNYTSILLASLSLLILKIANAQENTVIEISGFVTDQEKNQPLAGVTVSIKGTVSGTTTSNEGQFTIRTKQKLPFTLVFSSIGFKAQEVQITSLGSRLQVALVTQTVLGNEVVVTASRVPESILRSPVAIEKLDIRAIRETPAPSFYDALENVKGVQMTTSSLTFKVPNTRGFNIPNNFRFMQLVDGVDMQAATLGVPLGNAIGPTELDIQSVEITPGAASALYGMNAINGMANLLTKSPFNYQGLSVYQKTGINHVDNKDRPASVLTETAIRFAKAFKNKFAFKINFSYLRGTDWLSNSNTDQNPNSLNTANPAFSELNGKDNNPAYDAWNRYGDENNNAVTITGVNYNNSNRTFLLRRTGYWEKDLVNPVVDNLKFDVGLHYRVSENAELSYDYRRGKMDGVFQRGNKIQLNNVIVQNHKLELKGHHYFIRSYVSIEETGNSYNLKPLADNLQLTHLSNNAWGNRFKTKLQGDLDAGIDLATAMKNARAFADQGRVEPGTAAFESLKNQVIQINNWDHLNANIPGAPATGGARLLQKSRMYHTDAQYDFGNKIKFLHLLLGADFRIYEVIPDGNNFVDFSRPVADRNKPVEVDGKVPDSSDFGRNLYYKKFGAFAQVTKTFFEERLKVFASLRYDYNPEFDPKFNPRIAMVYTLNEKQNFRASFQNGFRFPALFEALSFVNNGNVRRVGGLSFINEGLGYLNNSYTLTSVNNFNAAYNRDRNPALGSSQVDTAAALKNKSLLEVTDISATRPERINSFEIGYKAVVLGNRLVIDWDAYFNEYDGFLGQVEVSVPENNNVQVGTDRAILDMLAANRSKQTRYRVFTNAKNKYHNFGSSLGLTWNFYKKFTISGNLNYNDIKTNKAQDIFITAFNTPKWVANLSFGNREIVKNFGFNIVWRWQDAFQWESPLANGSVAAYQTVDAQISYRIPKIKTSIKLGGSNIFNHRYIQYAAGPTIGGLYYTAITVEGLLKN
jgi:outer membrane receptor protein involved in Fe transport